MKRSNSLFDSCPFNWGDLTASAGWEMVVVGSGADYLGVDPKTASKLAQCSNMLLGIINKGERFHDYWKNHVTINFTSHKDDYKFRVDVVWRNLFCQYSNQLMKINLSKIGHFSKHYPEPAGSSAQIIMRFHRDPLTTKKLRGAGGRSSPPEDRSFMKLFPLTRRGIAAVAE